MEIGKEVLTVASQSFELATYSTPELRGLCNDWVGSIEREILNSIKEKGNVDPDQLAEHFRLGSESMIFITGKFEKEGKVKMQTYGSEGK